MKRIYVGKIKNMYVKNIEINGDKVDILTESIVLREDAPFYVNWCGRIVSFEYDTFLPTIDEADSFVRSVITSNPNALGRATCLYANYGNMSSREVSKEEFKALKKTYKKRRKEKRTD